MPAKRTRPKTAARPRSAQPKKASPKQKPTRLLAGNVQHLADRLNITPRRPQLLLQALTHKSAQQEVDLPVNERLEFLGDAILGLTIAEHLYRTHPDLAEGDLTKVKAVAVSETILAKAAAEINLGDYLIVSKGEEQSGGRKRPSILADALEALFAAIYLDRGARVAKDVILRLLTPHIRTIERDEHELDYKTLLQERVQELHRKPPTYRVIDESGPDHDRTFVTEVRVGSRVLGRGVGKSKKQAEQAAAQEAFTTD